jgi:hypothetical protein
MCWAFVCDIYLHLVPSGKKGYSCTIISRTRLFVGFSGNAFRFQFSHIFTSAFYLSYYLEIKALINPDQALLDTVHSDTFC